MLELPFDRPQMRPHVGPNLTCPGIPLTEQPLEELEWQVTESDLVIFETAADIVNAARGEGHVTIVEGEMPEGKPLPEGLIRVIIGGEWTKSKEGIIPFVRAVDQVQSKPGLGDK